MKTLIFQNSNKNIVMISALKLFLISWGFPGSFLGLPGDLVGNTRKPKESQKKIPGSTKEAKKLIGVQTNHGVEYFGGPAAPTHRYPHNQRFPHNQHVRGFFCPHSWEKIVHIKNKKCCCLNIAFIPTSIKNFTLRIW